MKRVSKYGGKDIYDERKESLTDVEVAGIEKMTDDFIEGELIYSDGIMYPEKENKHKGESIIDFYISRNGVLYMRTLDESEFENHWKVS